MWSATSGERFLRQRLRHVGELVGELVAAGAELLGLDLDGGESGGQVFLLQSAVFEGVEVAVDGLVDLGKLGFDGGQFGALVVFSGEVPSLGADDRIGDEAVVVAVEARDRIEHRGFDGVGVDAGGVALVGAGGASDIEDIARGRIGPILPVLSPRPPSPM
jgi:hypothetical protein